MSKTAAMMRNLVRKTSDFSQKSTRTKALFSTNNNAGVIPPDASSRVGAGVGNVHDQMLPSTKGNEWYKYCKYPRTVSIIG
jgi:hypothetical protein